MKTRKLFYLPLILLLASCSEGSNNDDAKQLSILCPSGAPSVAFTSFLDNPNFKVFSEAQEIIPHMVNESADVAVLPTNVGVQQISAKGLKYKLAATITFGNLFVASTGLDEDNVMDEGDYIVSFQQNAVPDKIFKSVYNVDAGLHYVASAQEAAVCLKTKKNAADNNAQVEYVLLAEPALTKLANGGAMFTTYANLQQEYRNKYNNQRIFQASIFVHNTLENETVSSFLNDVKANINSILDNPSQLDNVKASHPTMESVLGIDVSAAIASITNANSLGIGYEDAYTHKSEIDTFLNIFGISSTNEEIYFK